jgi:mercuric ion transport protein
MSDSSRFVGFSLLAGLAAGIGASACCAGPLLLVSLGLGGAWVSQLPQLEAVRPHFIVLSLAFFAAALYRLYILPRRCEPGQACAATRVSGRQRLLLWLALAGAVAVIAFPWYAFLFY